MIPKIKMLIVDVDGTLTDGGVYVDENGKETKKFNAKDGIGMMELQKNGVEVGHQLTPPDFPATSLSIASNDSVTGQPQIYSTTSATADVTTNPINNSQVEYFNLTSKSVGIPLIVGVGIT